MRILGTRLADDQIVGGAWQDTVDAFVDCDTRADDCELRLAQLADLAEHRGVDFDSWASLAERILGDEPHALSDAGEDMAEAIQSGKNHGGVEEQRRIELCELTLARLPTRSDVAVWLVINHASPADEYQEIGPVQLFAGVLWPERVRAGRSSDGQKEWTPPVELSDWESAKPMFERLDAHAERTFVRVFVEDTTPTLARQHARDGVQNLIDLANPNSGWTILEGAVSWRRGRGWSGTPFEEPASTEAGQTDVATARNLQHSSGDLMRRWLRRETVAVDAVEDGLWWVAVERAPTAAQRIMLAIRTVERTLGQVREGRDDSWTEPAGRFLRALWIENKLNREVFDAGLAAFNGLEKRGAAEMLERLRPVMFASPDYFNPASVIARGLAPLTSDLMAELLVGSMEHRLIRDAHAVLNSAKGAHDRLAELAVRFDRLLKRTERQRNALTHGTGTDDAVLRGVDGFAAELAAYAADEPLRQASTGKEPLSELEQHRVRALDQTAQLEARESPIDVLWPAE